MSASHPRFRSDFVAAVNNTLTDLSVDLDEDNITIDDIDESIALETYCTAALDCGVDYWLLRYGNKSGELKIGDALATYRDARSMIRANHDLIESRDATDGEVIGLMDE